MRTIRRRNWFIRRFALGLAIAAFVAPVAQANVAESSIVQAHTYQPVQAQGYQAFVTDFPSYPARSVADAGSQIANSDHPSLKPTLVADANHGTPRVVAFGWPGVNPNDYTPPSIHSLPMPHDPALTKADQGQPPSIGEPQVVSASFDWNDAAIGAGLALALVLLGVGAALARRHVGRAQTA